MFCHVFPSEIAWAKMFYKSLVCIYHPSFKTYLLTESNKIRKERVTIVVVAGKVCTRLAKKGGIDEKVFKKEFGQLFIQD